MRPEVSVIIASYNHAPYLEACIRSALAQDAELEVVVVDDRSKDDSVEIARSIEDSRVRVLVNGNNIGAYATQNRAIDESVGEHIAVLNSDDLWWPGKLSKQLEMLRNDSGPQFCYSRGVHIDDRGLKVDADVHAGWPMSEKQDLLPHLLVANRILASSVVFRRDAVRFSEGLRYSGDWVAAIQMSAQSPALFVDEELTGWRQHASNSYLRSEGVTTEEIHVRRAILRARGHWLSTRSDKDVIRAALSECAVHLTALYVLVGHMRLAKTTAALALSLQPSNSAAKKRLAVSLMPAILARKALWGGDMVRLPRNAFRSLKPLELG